MPQQRFTSIKTYDDLDFHESIKMDEFWRDIAVSFGRSVKQVGTINNHLTITLDDDIPNSDGVNSPFFEPEYYGFTRG